MVQVLCACHARLASVELHAAYTCSLAAGYAAKVQFFKAETGKQPTRKPERKPRTTSGLNVYIKWFNLWYDHQDKATQKNIFNKRHAYQAEWKSLSESGQQVFKDMASNNVRRSNACMHTRSQSEFYAIVFTGRPEHAAIDVVGSGPTAATGAHGSGVWR